MSRTDAHRPPFVWLADHPELVREYHDHTDGVCTLPPGSAPNMPAPWSAGRCYTTLDPMVRVCGCQMCTGRYARRQSNARRRQAQRTLLRAAPFIDLEEFEELEGRLVAASRFAW